MKKHWIILATVLLIVVAGCKRAENANTTATETATTGSPVVADSAGTGYSSSDTGANLSTMATTDTAATLGTSATSGTTGSSGTAHTEKKSGSPSPSKTGT